MFAGCSTRLRFPLRPLGGRDVEEAGDITDVAMATVTSGGTASDRCTTTSCKSTMLPIGSSLSPSNTCTISMS